MVQEYPLSTHLLALSRVWRSPDGADYVIAAKGAPEAIADLCHFDGAQTRDLAAAIARMTDEGLRTLGVARSRVRLADLPPQQYDFDFDDLAICLLAGAGPVVLFEAFKLKTRRAIEPPAAVGGETRPSE